MELDLSKYRFNVHSQNGEDGVIAELLDMMNLRTGTLVEFGAWNGIHFSNIHLHYEQSMFAANGGFKTMRIECDPARYQEMLQMVPQDESNILLNCCISTEGETSLNYLFLKHGITNIPVLSIDVDGQDLNIWNSLNSDAFRPAIVIIEEGRWQSAEILSAMELIFKHRGYTLAHVTGNFIFVDERRMPIEPAGDIHQLMRKSGHPEYDFFYGKIDLDEYKSRTHKGLTEQDAFIQFAEPQPIKFTPLNPNYNPHKNAV